MNASKTWASIALTSPARTEPVEPSTLLSADESCAVVDANALIGGSIPRSFADQLVTTSQVLGEVKDKQSKQALGALPFGIAVQEPTEASVEAVTKFARATGDIHSLSAADIRLIALAHTLHAARFGLETIRTEPQPARAVSKAQRAGQKLPGWGAEGGTWEELDRLDETGAAPSGLEEEGAAESRIAAQVQNLSLGTSEPAQPRTPLQRPQPRPIAVKTSHTPVTEGDDNRLRVVYEPGAEQSSGGNSSESEDEDSGWEVAAITRNAARRRRRKEVRKQARKEIQEAAEKQSIAQPSFSVPPNSPEPASNSRGDSAAPIGLERSAHDAEPANGSEQYEAESASEEGSHSADEEAALDCFEGSEGAEQSAAVVIVTGDFAMQNVILQMGLQLVSPHGVQIRKISRWVLRCSACFKVTKETERLFCPICGNAALQRVEMVIGENGAEQYGVRKRHNIRGTKYSLPKPKGGKKSKNPILREDMLLQRMPKRKPKVAGTDPFAPEYNTATWHDLRGSGSSALYRGIAAALPSAKHNPNERRHVRSNRRK